MKCCNFKTSIRSRRTIAILAGIVVLSVLLVALYIANRATSVYSFYVTDASPTSMTFVWRTKRPVVGSVVMSEGNARESIFSFQKDVLVGDQVFWDVRDYQENDNGTKQRVSTSRLYTHRVTITGLDPETEYSAVLVHNFVPGRTSNLYSFKTLPERNEIGEPEPVYGLIESDVVQISDSVIVAQVVEASSGLDASRSQFISVSATEMKSDAEAVDESESDKTTVSYVLDVGGLADESFTEDYPSLFQNLDAYELELTVLTPGGTVQYRVNNMQYQPVDTLSIGSDDLQSRLINKLVPPVYAACQSTCVGDCQGCNIDTAGNPACATYGCGYMSWCCGSTSTDCNGHCQNGKQDCDENGVDCGGGGCKSCNGGYVEPSGECKGLCKAYGSDTCVPPNPATGKCGCAIDGIVTTIAGETGRNCGGDYCPSCDNPGSHCFDRVKNPDEDGVDCGGSCAASCLTAGSSKTAKIGTICSNDGEVFTCADRTDWDCWCFGGKVAAYHTKSASLYVAPSATAGVRQEGRTSYSANSKFGIHTGMGAGGAYGDLLDGGDIGYVMNVVSTPEDYAALLQEYQNLPPGVVPIIRFCHGDNVDSCAFSDVTVAANFIKSMEAALGRPIAVISGPNEALDEPWTLPGGCTADHCAGQVPEVAAATAAWMNAFLDQTEGVPNLIRLSSDLNTSEAAFETFVAEMKKSNAEFDRLDGVAGNAYEDAGGKTIAQVVQELKDMGFSDIFITEAGIDPYGSNNQAATPENFQKVLNALMEIKDDPAIKSILLFNPLEGFNDTPLYDKHELSRGQLDEVIGALSDTHVEATGSRITGNAPGAGIVPAATGGGSCNRGDYVIETGQVCCKGKYLKVCLDSSGNGVVYGTSDDADGEFSVDGRAYENLGHDLDSRQKGLGTVGNRACVFTHVLPGNRKYDDNPSSPNYYPDHEEMCISRGGGNVGLGSPGGYNLRPLFSGTALATDDTVEPGTYTVTSQNADVTTQTINVLYPGAVRYFYDDNENGVMDSNENYLTDSESETIEIQLEKKTDILTYTFESGWNPIAIPLVMQDEDTSQIVKASDMIAYLADSGVDATHIASYRGQNFIIYSERVGEDGVIRAYGTDFGIMPGEGYFIKSNNSESAALSGYLASESVPISLTAGWNLVGFYKHGKETLEAYSVLEAIEDSNIPADILTKRENSRYVSVIRDNSTVYGDNFDVYQWRGYWVRVGNDGGFTEKTYTP